MPAPGCAMPPNPTHHTSTNYFTYNFTCNLPLPEGISSRRAGRHTSAANQHQHRYVKDISSESQWPIGGYTNSSRNNNFEIKYNQSIYNPVPSTAGYLRREPRNKGNRAHLSARNTSSSSCPTEMHMKQAAPPLLPRFPFVPYSLTSFYPLPFHPFTSFQPITCRRWQKKR